jgi:RsiW-degrading membrane proteinase PrsW (M82 family)
MNVLILLAFAIAPGVCIATYIYLKDKHEREPIGLLVKSFFYGMGSVLVTLIISIPISQVVPINTQDYSEQAVHAFLIVALVEEFSKYIFVRGILFKNENFNEPFDGIVYSVMVSMGFATLENIMYVADGGWGVAVLRMFTAVPAHAAFAVLMGYYLGLAKFVHHKSHYGWYGLGIATLFHGAYDYFWFIAEVKDVWAGIWLGALVSLVVGIILSKKAIKIHQEASPFQFQAIHTEPIPEDSKPSDQNPESTDHYKKE